MSIYQKCIPTAYSTSIFEISYQTLKEQGINTLFFDLDNTIIAYDETRLASKHIEFLNDLAKDFKILVISNSGKKRVSFAMQDVDFLYVWHGKKPLKFGFKKALKLTNAKKEEVMMIGDQLMTDVYGSNRIGLNVTLVGAVKRSSDRKITKINRHFENIILKKIAKKYPERYAATLKNYVQNN